MSLVKTDSISEHTVGAGTAFTTKVTMATPLAVAGLITASGGINFGQQTLADYEEGTWTPTFKGSTVAGAHTYSVQNGTYTRIGRLIVARCFLLLNVKDGTMSGTVSIAGLPYPSNAGSGVSQASAVSSVHNITFPAGRTQLTGDLGSATTAIGISVAGSGLANASLDSSGIVSGSALMLSVSYHI